MSEAERRKRQNYKKNRQRCMLAAAALILLVAVITLVFSVVYTQLSKTYYIDYTESGTIDYKVQLKENDFYPDEWQEPGQAYVASLINAIAANIKYNLNIPAENVNFDYSYGIAAKLVIHDDDKNADIYKYTDVIKEQTAYTASNASNLVIQESVSLDYAKYNEIASRFLSQFRLGSTTSTLMLEMNVSVTGTSLSFGENSKNDYSVALVIPLTERTVDINISSSVPTQESKVLAYNNAANTGIFKNLAIISGSFDVLLIILFIAFIFLTRNHDINYSNKVRRLVSSYRSYIQKINSEFDTSGYQVLMVDSFSEMLGIRDTIESPILMNENLDQTRTRFIIPTNTKLLYMYEIKVEDYDEIYGNTEASEEKPADSAEEIKDAEGAVAAFVIEAEPVAEENPLEEENEAAPAEELTDEEDVSEEALSDTESEENSEEDETIEKEDESGNKIIIHFTRSFSARLIQSKLGVKNYYSELRNHILSYKGVKARTSWKYESYNKGRAQLIKLKIRGNTILMYCALNPEEFEYTKYFHESAKAKIYSAVPMLVRIKSDRGLSRAKALVNLLMEKSDIPVNTKAEFVDYVSATPYESTKALIDRALIKVLSEEAVIPEEKETDIKPREEEAVLDTSSLEAAEEATAETAEEATAEASPIEEIAEESSDAVVSPVLEEESYTEASEDSDDETNGWTASSVKVNRSYIARVIQSDRETKRYYSDIKNFILSYKGVKSRTSWRCETFKCGKNQLMKIKLRGKMLLLYLALDPNEYEYSIYFHETDESKAYKDVPMLFKVKSERGVGKAKRLIKILMEKMSVEVNPKATEHDYSKEYPFESTEALLDKKLAKILVENKELSIESTSGCKISDIVAALASDDLSLSDIDYVKEPGAELKANAKTKAVGVVFNEKEKDNVIYRYDPNGNELNVGDTVLIPVKSKRNGKPGVRKAVVAIANCKTDAEGENPKIISVVERKETLALK